MAEYILEDFRTIPIPKQAKLWTNQNLDNDPYTHYRICKNSGDNYECSSFSFIFGRGKVKVIDSYY